MLRAWLGQCLDQNTPGYLHPISDAVFVFNTAMSVISGIVYSLKSDC